MKTKNDKKSAKEVIDPDEFENRININWLSQGKEFKGYLLNIKPHKIIDEQKNEESCLLLYFIDEKGETYKSLYKYEPYFYIIVKQDSLLELQQFIARKFEGKVSSTDIIERLDLDLINHLSGLKSKLIKISFKNIPSLIQVRKELRQIVQKNKTKEKILSYSELLNPSNKLDLMDMILDTREDDVPYHVRVAIDNEIRCGCWYDVSYNDEIGCNLKRDEKKLTKADLRILAFDIETTKAPLKFPDPRIDNIIMISYMVDGQGFLIVNRQIISEDIDDFEYSPKPEFEGFFHIFNEPDEKSLLIRFAQHCKEIRVNVFVTFNGDDFDIPFIQERMKSNGLSLEGEFGLVGASSSSNGKDEFMGRFSTHIDCLYWVRRDAFLPQGSHGLKNVTKAKLGYDPIEVDPEKMLSMAKNDPKKLCAYSVSDALATYYLYKLMIHDFIFALCTIIPTFPDEVLRKGSGTLCEELLMAQAFRRDILFPNKQVDEFEKFFKGHLINSETYIGGHVECLNMGVYRSDIPVKFKLDPNAYDYLTDNIDNYIEFCLTVESGVQNYRELLDEENIKEVKENIRHKLNSLKNVIESSPNNIIEEKPLIYHLDVSAMYPNIILTNRLQPVAIVDEQICAGCIYNKESNNCKRNLNWRWKGELFPLQRSEYENLKNQYEFELLNNADATENIVELTVEEHRVKFLKRIKDYCKNSYKQQHISKIETKEDTVCMRENSFYVDTVRDFRDRRYDFKALVKTWKAKLEDAKKEKNFEKIEEAKNLAALYESLQLAHKIILNSFYGYVMRRGARWFKMEMAAMVTHIGSNIITDSRILVDRIGKPLELDTDGIWCLLPAGFPEGYSIKLKNGKKINFNFPCTMLNHLIYEKYCNPQYQVLDKESNTYITKTEMSIFFEIDGPYRCMVIPAAKEEGKMLKKRYAVFTMSGKLNELKGFELKRRGELKIIKIFQSQVFDYFLKGNNLKECYHACGEVADRWYTILENKGVGVPDEEVFDYIQESKIMSKSLSEYGSQKSTAITCAKRLLELIGTEIMKDKGLCVKYIISKKPYEAPVAERAVPTIIFMSERSVKQKFLRKWLKDYEIDPDIDMRDVIDWEYYKDRLAGTILKILIIPAIRQKIENPLPKIPCPDWVNKLVKNAHVEQRNLNHFYKNISNVDKFLKIEENMNQLATNELKYEDNNDNEMMDIENTGGDYNKKKFAAKKNNKSNNNNNLNNFIKKGKNKIEYEVDSLNQEENDIKEKEKITNLEPKFEKEINLLEDTDGWLSQQKKKWKFLQVKRKETELQLKNTTNIYNNITPMHKNIFGNKFPNQKENLFRTSNLKIFQISEQNHGIMKLWVSFGNFVEIIYVNFKRSLYINSHKTDVPDIFKPVSLSLPRNKPLINLYEFKIEEKDFKEKFNNFSDYIIDPTIEGVYETKQPLLFKAISEFGCQIRLKDKDQKFLNNSIQKNIFDSEDFESRPIISNNNINSDNYFRFEEFSKIYFYIAGSNTKHFAVLINFSLKRITFIICDKIKRPKEAEENILDIIKKIINKNESLMERFDLTFEVQQIHENDIKNVFKFVNKNLIDLKNSGTIPPGVIVLQSCYSQQYLIKNGLNCIQTEFPVMELKFEQDDNNFIVFNWVRDCVTKTLFRFSDIKIKLEFNLLLSRYCNIPICNVSNDPYIDCIDIIFSRVLRSEKQISWYSPSGFPDLGGGTEGHDFLGEVENEFPKIIKPGLYMGYSCQIDIGLFCVNAILESDKMKDISGNYELKHIDNKKMQISGKNSYLIDHHLERDEFVLGANAYIVMKKLIEKWLYDVKVHENVCADILLVHFYRWISSFNSKFYDPVLQRMINKLMQKYFSILIRKITDFQFEILYADYKKIFITNHKDDFESTYSSVEHLIRSIKKIPIFSHITLTPNTFYKCILFKDYFNYTGIELTEANQNAITPKITTKWKWSDFLPNYTKRDFISVISDFISKLYRYFYNQDSEMIMNLMNLYLHKNMSKQEAIDYLHDKENYKNFKEFLVKDYYSIKVFELIPTLMKKSKDDYLDDELEIENDFQEIKIEDNLNKNEDGLPGKIFNEEDFEGSDREGYYSDISAANHKQIVREKNLNTNKKKGKNKEHKNINTSNKKFFNNNLMSSSKSFKSNLNSSINIYDDFSDNYNQKNTEWDFPVILGSFQNFQNVSLEYIKFLTEVLAIDPDLSEVAYKLKKNSLKLINIEEFSKETEFVEPCRTFILHDVVCELCSTNKDFDFCRDSSILSNDWKCELCNTSFDREFIEFLIIQKVRSLIDYYFNQDLKCRKCRMQKNELIYTRCECAGEFSKTYEENFFEKIPGNNIKTMDEFLGVIFNIASYYQFNNLRSMLEQMSFNRMGVNYELNLNQYFN